VRCFAACFPDARSRFVLSEIRLPAGLRRIPPENLHLTLRFYGDLEPAGAEKALVEVAALESVATSVELWALRAFPEPSRARVVAVLVAADSRLREWRRALGGPAPAPGKDDFTPHVSLARTAGEVDLRAQLAAFEIPRGLRILLLPPALYASRLSREGARYSPIRGSESTQ
jgi:2'-5' RNA ligase